MVRHVIESPPVGRSATPQLALRIVGIVLLSVFIKINDVGHVSFRACNIVSWGRVDAWCTRATVPLVRNRLYINARCGDDKQRGLSPRSGRGG